MKKLSGLVIFGLRDYGRDRLIRVSYAKTGSLASTTEAGERARPHTAP